MRGFFTILLAVAFALSACVGAGPLSLADDNPASPKAAPGPVDVPSAIATYKSAADFSAQAADTEAPPGGHAGMHGAMPEMPGMQHGAAPHGADER